MSFFTERSKKHPMGGHGVFDLTGFPQVVKLEEKYLPAGELTKYENSSGLYDPRYGRASEIGNGPDNEE